MCTQEDANNIHLSALRILQRVRDADWLIRLLFQVAVGADGLEMGRSGYTCVRHVFCTLNVLMWVSGCTHFRSPQTSELAYILTVFSHVRNILWLP
jgi:hypothetical protein